MIESLHLQFPCFKSQVNAKAAENAKGRKNPQHDRKGLQMECEQGHNRKSRAGYCIISVGYGKICDHMPLLRSDVDGGRKHRCFART